MQDATALPPTYADLGIEETAAHRWQALAAVPKAEREGYVRKRTAAGRGNL